MEFIYNDLPKTQIPDDIMHPSSRKLFRFWESARGENAAPIKQELELKKIAQILPNLCILERERHKPAYIWRLAGTATCNLWGTQLTGSSFSDGWADHEQQSLASALDMLLVTSQPFVARFRAVSQQGSEIGIEMIAFPIQDKNSGCIQVLCLVVPFHTPDWLGSDQLNHFELSTLRNFKIDEIPGNTTQTTKIGSFPKIGKKLPFLRVIDGGK